MAAVTSTFPPGTKYDETPDWAGGTQAHMNIALVVISAVFLGTRLYVRFFMTKSPGLDDAVAFIAFAIICSQSAFNIHLRDAGAGAHMELLSLEQILMFFQGLNNLNLLYFWGVGFDRLAILAFLPRLHKDRTYLIMVYTTATLVLITTIVCFLIRLLQCMPVSDGWLPPMTPGTKCLPFPLIDGMMNAHAITGIIYDFVLMALPIWVIYTKMLWSRKMFQVVAVFSVGIFVIITGIIRLYYIKTMDWSVDTTFKMSTIGVWTDLESHVGFWCGCFPSLQPILRTVAFKLGLRSSLDSTNKKSTGHTGANSRNRTGSVATRSRTGYMRKGSGIDVDAETNDSDSQRGIVSPGEFEMGKYGEIRKQTDVIVSVEDKRPKKGDRKETWVDI